MSESIKKYDPTDRGSILAYAQRLVGKTLRQVTDAGDLAGELIHGKAAALLCRPRRQRQYRHRAAEQAEQQVHLVCPFPISLNAFQKSTTFLYPWEAVF